MKSLFSIIILLLLLNSIFIVKEIKANNTVSFHYSYIKKINDIPNNSELLTTLEFIHDIKIEQCKSIFEKDNISNNNYNKCKDIVDIISTNKE